MRRPRSSSGRRSCRQRRNEARPCGRSTDPSGPARRLFRSDDVRSSHVLAPRPRRPPNSSGPSRQLPAPPAPSSGSTITRPERRTSREARPPQAPRSGRSDHGVTRRSLGHRDRRRGNRPKYLEITAQTWLRFCTRRRNHPAPTPRPISRMGWMMRRRGTRGVILNRVVPRVAPDQPGAIKRGRPGRHDALGAGSIRASASGVASCDRAVSRP